MHILIHRINLIQMYLIICRFLLVSHCVYFLNRYWMLEMRYQTTLFKSTRSSLSGTYDHMVFDFFSSSVSFFLFLLIRFIFVCIDNFFYYCDKLLKIVLYYYLLKHKEWKERKKEFNISVTAEDKGTKIYCLNTLLFSFRNV